MASIVDERGFNQGFRLTPAQRIRLARRAEAIAAAMDLPQDSNQRSSLRILELGCGTGELAHLLATLTGGQVTGVDLSPRFILEAMSRHQHPNLNFQVLDLARCAPPDAQLHQYHYIVGNGILHHLYHNLDAFLAALEKWLAPEGRLIFWEPNLWNPYIFLIFTFGRLRRRANLEPDEMAFTARFITTKLLRCGYRSVRVSTRDFLLPNTPTPCIRPLIRIGGWAERIPGVRRLAQSLFIVATAGGNLTRTVQ